MTPESTPVSEHADEKPARSSQRLIDVSFALVILVLILAFRLARTMRPVTDPDVWWHLAAGRWMTEHGAVPDVDPFAAAGQAREWLEYSWSVDVLWWWGYRVLGLAAPLIYSAAMTGLVLWVCAGLVRRNGTQLVRRCFVAAVGFLTLSTVLGPRTYLFTTVFTGLVLIFVRRYLRGTASAASGLWLVPMFAIWANVHVEFLYGLFFLGLAGCDLLYGVWRRRVAPAVFYKLAALTVACLLATVVNPFGLRLHRMMASAVGDYATHDLVLEMRANEFRSVLDYLLLVWLVGAAVTLTRRRDCSIYAWGALAMTAYMSFHSQRAIWMVVFVALDIVADHPWLAKGHPDAPAIRALRLFWPIAMAATVGAFAARVIAVRDDLAPTASYPYAAAAFARAVGLTGPIFTDWNWGGFCRFAMPQVPGNIDGRGTIFGANALQKSIDTWAARPGWRDDPDLDHARFVMANARTALSQILRFDTRFGVAFEDPVAVIFVRRVR